MFDINIVGDDSVYKLTQQTAEKLHKKYNKQREIKERYLKKKKPLKILMNVILDIFCVLILLCGFVVCFATINSTLNGYIPNVAGYTNMVVASESMVKSGFNVGDIIVIHSVETDTLNVGDKIAFYNYVPSWYRFDVNKTQDVSDVVSETKYKVTFPQLFGFRTKEIIKATDANSELIFHHIRAIYEDENGERWFKTYGSSNQYDDSWYINEKYVVGIQDDGAVSTFMLKLINIISKPHGILILLIPAGILILSLVLSFLKSIQIAKLELDCVEEKRKITDPICVKNKVGLQMDKKTKYKILAQADDSERMEYIKLLWKDGEAPYSIVKYYLRKKLLVSANKELLELNRHCEEMFKRGEDPTKIAKHYLKEKDRIKKKAEQNKEESIKKRMRI